NPFGKSDNQTPRFIGKRLPFLLGNDMQTDGPRDQVWLESFRAQYFRQPAHSPAAQVVELEQAVLGDGLTESDKEIFVVVGENMRNAPLVADNAYRVAEIHDSRARCGGQTLG